MMKKSTQHRPPRADPTTFESIFDAHGFYVREARNAERTVYEIQELYVEKFGKSTDTDMKIKNNPDFRVAVADQQFYERRANSTGVDVIITLMSRQLTLLDALTKKLNALGVYDDVTTDSSEG